MIIPHPNRHPRTAPWRAPGAVVTTVGTQRRTGGKPATTEDGQRRPPLRRRGATGRAKPPCCDGGRRPPRPSACRTSARCAAGRRGSPRRWCGCRRTLRPPVHPRSLLPRPVVCTPGTSCVSCSPLRVVRRSRRQHLWWRKRRCAMRAREARRRSSRSKPASMTAESGPACASSYLMQMIIRREHAWKKRGN